MAGGKSRPKKDRGVKVSSGQIVKTGQILIRGIPTYKRGINVAGEGSLYATCSGEIYFTRKKTSHGKVRTFINIRPEEERLKAA